MTSPKKSTSSLIQTDTTIIEQLPSTLPNASILVGTATMTTKEIVALLQSEVSVIKSAAALVAQYHQVMTQVKAIRPQSRKARLALRNYVAVNLGETSSQFLALGFTPRKSPITTVAAKAGGIVKRAATRLARHTMGSKQKQAIKGEAVPAAPATPAAPTATPNTAK